MVSTRIVLAAALGAALAGSAAPVAEARSSGPTLRDRQQAACYHDVQRLCGSAIPDVNKVSACMKPRKAQVSAKCRALWDVK